MRQREKERERERKEKPLLDGNTWIKAVNRHCCRNLANYMYSEDSL